MTDMIERDHNPGGPYLETAVCSKRGWATAWIVWVEFCPVIIGSRVNDRSSNDAKEQEEAEGLRCAQPCQRITYRPSARRRAVWRQTTPWTLYGHLALSDAIFPGYFRKTRGFINRRLGVRFLSPAPLFSSLSS